MQATQEKALNLVRWRRIETGKAGNHRRAWRDNCSERKVKSNVFFTVPIFVVFAAVAGRLSQERENSSCGDNCAHESTMSSC